MSDKSIGQWVGAIVGTVIGYFTGNVALGYAIGTAIGGYLDPPKGPTIEGPRLQDLNVQLASLGAPMGRIYGTVGLQGNVIWVENNKIKEVVRKQKQGGKGGGGSTVKTYSYFGTFAVALCEGPIVGVRRVWVGNDLIYNSGSTKLSTVIASNAAMNGLSFFGRIGIIISGKGNKGVNFSVYRGTADQQPDPRIEADLGIGRAPAFRGTAYIVFYDLPLERYGNTLLGAQVKVEVAQNADSSFEIIEQRKLRPNGAIEGFPGSSIYFNSGVSAFYFPHWGNGYENQTLTRVEQNLDRMAISTIEAPVRGSLIYNGVSDVDSYLIRSMSPPSRIFIDGKRYFLEGSSLQSVGGSTSGFVYANGVLFVAYFLTGAIGRLMPRPDPSTESSITDETAVAGARAIAASPDGQDVYVLSDAGIHVLDGRYGAGLSEIEFFPKSWSVSGEPGEARCVFSNGILYCFISSGALRNLILVDPTNGETIDVIEGTDIQPESSRGFNVSDGVISYTRDDYNQISWNIRYYALSVFSNKSVPLSQVIRQEISRSELVGINDIDSSDLTDQVAGYRIAGVQQIRAVLSPLQGAYPFDIIPSGYQIKAVRRGKSSVKTIPVEELDARAYGSEAQPMLEQSREMDSQLPRKVTLRYLDASREYEINEQYSPERQSSQAVNIREFEMPLVLSADQAAGVAEVLQYVPWLERTPMQFRLGPEHLDLEPADVITIDAPYGQFPVRLDSIKYGPNGVLECTARPNAPAIWTPNAAGGEGVIPDGEVGLAADAVIELMDIPLIRDSDDQPGFAAAMAGTNSSWEGGVLFRSADNGQTWQDVQAWSAPVTMGYARNALAANDGYVIDRASQLQVDLIAGELESITEAQMLTGLHWVAYGADQRWELIRFANADLQADGSYILSTLIRGARGTEWATGLHQAGDAVVLLDDADVAGILTSVETLNLIMQWRGVSVGQDINEAPNVPFAYRGVNLRPLSPVHPIGTVALGDWLISATRRSRYTTSWWTTGIERPIGESSEAWEVEILDGSSVARTLTAASLPITYTEQQQIEDFGSTQQQISAIIYQMSSVVGRGYPLEANLVVDEQDPYFSLVELLMHFDGAPSSTSFVDSSSRSRTITPSGSAHISTASAKFFQSGRFSGSGDFLTLTAPLIPASMDFTVELFIRIDSQSGRYDIVSQGSGSNTGRTFLYVNNGKFVLFVGGSPNVELISTTTLSIDQWYYVAVRRSSGVFEIWIDGQLEGSASSATSVQQLSTFYIARLNSGTPNYFAGYLDELRITAGIARDVSSVPSEPFLNQ